MLTNPDKLPVDPTAKSQAAIMLTVPLAFTSILSGARARLGRGLAMSAWLRLCIRCGVHSRASS